MNTEPEGKRAFSPDYLHLQFMQRVEGVPVEPRQFHGLTSTQRPPGKYE
jgi:hypothetical protein